MTSNEQSVYDTMKKVIGDRGEILKVICYGDVMDDTFEFTVIFDTEHAALSAFYKYRFTFADNASCVNIGESPNHGGWYITIR